MAVELTIETLTIGGRGLGRHQGKAVFVPLTAPGDRVRCRLVQEKSHYAVGELVELLTPSAQRRQPPCPYFGSCGGCQWQHLDYPVQSEWKQRLFRELLARQRLAEAEHVLPLVRAEAEFGYRNRVQFKCRQTADGFVIGFYRAGSHFVVDVARCPLLAPRLQAALDLLRDLLPGAPRPECIPQVDVACDDQDDLQIILHALPEGAGELRNWLEPVARDHGFAAGLQTGRKATLDLVYGQPALTYRVGSPPCALQVSAGGFAQINSAQNRRMVDAVVTAAGLTGTERVADLYCGMGNFSVPLARRAGQLVGVEEFAGAIDDARRNAAANGVTNAEFHAEDAVGALTRHCPAGAELVVLDPPRTGCYPVMRELLALVPGRIIYVSCDPATLARDLKPLVHGGYRVVSSQPLDLFPQTWHVESLTVLERQPAR